MTDSDKEIGIEIEPGRSRSMDEDIPVDSENQYDTEQSEMKKDELREEIKKIEKEIASITNTLSYGDDERLAFLETKLDSLKSELLKDDVI